MKVHAVVGFIIITIIIIKPTLTAQIVDLH